MAIPTVTREYTPGSCPNLRNPMRHPHHHKMRLDSLALPAEQCHVPNQTCKELDLPDGTTESPQEHCQSMRKILMSPQEYKIPRCTPNQLEMKPIYPSLAPELSCVPHHTEQVA